MRLAAESVETGPGGGTRDEQGSKGTKVHSLARLARRRAAAFIESATRYQGSARFWVGEKSTVPERSKSGDILCARQDTAPPAVYTHAHTRTRKYPGNNRKKTI